MTLNHRRTLGLIASGAALFLFSSWLLHITLPPRDTGAHPAARKAVRENRGQRRSQSMPSGGHVCIAWGADGYYRAVAV